MSETYKIVRHYQYGSKRTVSRGLSLEQAQKHCDDPEASSDTCASSAGKRRTKTRGPWFDGYYKE